MAGPHRLAHFVVRSRNIAAAVQRRVEGRPRPPAVVEADLVPVLALIAATDAEARALADTLKRSIAAGIERLRYAAGVREFYSAQREVDLQNNRVAYEMRSAIAEGQSLRQWADALRAELDAARACAL
jgi:hypothetical protein